MKINCAHTELVDLGQLKPNPKNPNHHPQVQIDKLAKIIDYQGQRAPIVVSKRSGLITKGHGRLMAIQKLGWLKAAVDYQDYESEAQEYADMVADNKIAELAEHDDEKFLAELDGDDDLKALDEDVFGIDREIAKLKTAVKRRDREKKAKKRQIVECPQCQCQFDQASGEVIETVD